MLKNKRILLSILVVLILLLVPNMAKAAATVERNVLSSKVMQYIFSGITLNEEHQYEYGFSTTKTGEVKNWYSITDYSATSANVGINLADSNMKSIFDATDTGYVTIRDVTDDKKTVVEPTAVDLKIPYLQLTNYSILTNGKELSAFDETRVEMTLRTDERGIVAYYQYEKITDANIINKYKEIKAKNGSVLEMQSSLKQTVPSNGWKQWDYWYIGQGRPVKTVIAPDTGLYYLWVYFSEAGYKDLYGYILVDNLQPEIALDSISLPKTKEVELGKTLTLTPTFSPENTTNKIVTWSSSDESVATVDNAGKITPKKIGSTIITVTTQDGNKKATCTVTVINASSANNNPSSNNPSGNNASSNNLNNGNNNNKPSSGKNDTTIAPGNIPYTGGTITVITMLIVITGIGVYSYKRNKDLKGI